MASTVNVGNTTTACTFNQWRITTNLMGDDLNEVARGNFTKELGNLTLSNGTLLLACTTGTILEVKANARIDGTADSRNIRQDEVGVVLIRGGDIQFSNRNAAGLFRAEVNTRFDSAYVAFTNATVGLVNVNTRNVIVNTANTLFQNTAIASIFKIDVANTIFSGNTVNVSSAAGSAKFEVTPNTFIYASANVTNNVSVGGTLETTGNVTLLSNVSISKNTTIIQNADIGGSINVGFAAVITGNTTIGGNTVIGANTSISGNLDVTGNATTGNLSTVNIVGSGLANIAIANLTTAFIESLSLTNPIQGPAETDLDSYRLRVDQTTRGDGSFGVFLGSAANGNAFITFDTTSGNVWRVTANSTEGTYHTLITMQNVVAGTGSTSQINVAAANTVNSLNTIIGTTFTTVNTTFATTNTAINNRVTSVSGTAGRITSSGGTTPTIDLATAGAGSASYSSGISALTVDAYGRVTSVTGSAAYITSSGRAFPRRSDGTNIDFSFSGNAGQPTWLWGTNDGVTMAVWNPSNFSVSYAASAGNASTVGGIGAGSFALLSGATFTGNIFAPAFFYSSDRKLKENIKTIDNALNTVTRLRGVSYNFIKDENKTKQIGVIAQEIKQFLPEVVSTSEDGMHSVSYGNIVGVLIEAIKELKGQLDLVKKELNTIRTSNGE